MPDSQSLVEIALSSGTLPDLPSGHFIDGSFIAASSGRSMESFDPGRSEPFAHFARGNVADIEVAVASARRAFEQVWRDLPAAERGRILYRAAD